MSRNHPAIDFAQAVLSKYPDARAMSFGPSMNETWRIYAGHKIGWLSELDSRTGMQPGKMPTNGFTDKSANHKIQHWTKAMYTPEPCEKCGYPAETGTLCAKCLVEKKHPSGARVIANLAYIVQWAKEKRTG